MKAGAMHNWKDQELEVMTLEFDACPCEQTDEGIIFGDDSVSVNTLEPYKMLTHIDLAEVHWKSEGMYVVPVIPSMLIDSIDQRSDAAYGLIPVTEGAIGCEILWMLPEPYENGATSQVYAPSLREGKRFVREGQEQLFDVRKLEEFVIVYDAPPKGKGVKKIKHRKNQRKR